MKQFILDRFEGTVAVLEGEDGAMRDVPAARLPAGAKQGDVLAEENGVFRVDAAATKAREAVIRKKMRGLFDR